MMPTMRRPPNSVRRPAAVAALAERPFVSVAVLLELEWVMRGLCGLPTGDISRVLRVLRAGEHCEGHMDCAIPNFALSVWCSAICAPWS